MMSSALKTRRRISAEAPLGLRTAATRTLVSSTKRILQAICLPEAPGASVLVARVRGPCRGLPFVEDAAMSGRPRSPARLSPQGDERAEAEAEQARAARAVQERRRAGEGLWAPGGGRAAWAAIAGLYPAPMPPQRMFRNRAASCRR